MKGTNVYDPSNLLDAMLSTKTEFERKRQEDAHEFLLYIFENSFRIEHF
jgi:uncharacterized UBP type Zn finger protein